MILNTTKTWGLADVSLDPRCLSSLKLKRALNVLKGTKGKVLEVGCGAGMFTLAIKKHCPNLQVEGSDLDKKSIAIAKSRSNRVKFFVSDVNKMSTKNESYDAIVAFDLFEHLEDPGKAFKEVYRTLKPGGALHTYIPCEGNIYTIHGLSNALGFNPKIKLAGHIQQFSTYKLIGDLIDIGFEVKRPTFSYHFVGQFIDFGYFIFLTLLRKNTKTTIEGMLVQKGGSKKIIWKLLGVLKDLISIFVYIESSVFAFIPAHGAHITCIKKNK